MRLKDNFFFDPRDNNLLDNTMPATLVDFFAANLCASLPTDNYDTVPMENVIKSVMDSPCPTDPILAYMWHCELEARLIFIKATVFARISTEVNTIVDGDNNG